MMKKLFLGALALVLTVVPAQAGVQEDLNAAIAKLSEDQQSALLFLLTGAQAGGGSDEDAILGVLNGFAAAAADEDAAAMMAFVSDDFEHWEFGDKDGLQDAYEALIDEGMFEERIPNAIDHLLSSLLDKGHDFFWNRFKCHRADRLNADLAVIHQVDCVFYGAISQSHAVSHTQIKNGLGIGVP